MPLIGRPPSFIRKDSLIFEASHAALRLSYSRETYGGGPVPVASVQGFHAVRDHTEALADPLSPEDQVVQSMTDCSPTKWHRGHTTWFFEEFVLQKWAAPYERYHPRFQYLFNSYYEAIGPRQPRPQRGMITRPSVAEVAGYRAGVDAAMSALLTRSDDPDLLATVELGLNHEQQHQELLLMDIKHLLSQNPLHPTYQAASGQNQVGTPKPMAWVAHPGGVAEIGNDGQGFAYDNEGPRHRVFLAPFAMADRLVTAGEWLDFIADGGYQRADLWLSDGWAHINEEQWQAPLYWEQVDGVWHVFTLNGLVPVDPAAPVVHVSYYEADAFARWSGARLPTEAEWEVTAAAAGLPDAPYGLHPQPLASDIPAGGVAQLFGEVWQWTSSPYTPYPGFRTAPGAVGEYNGKFMVDQQVLRGSASITSEGHARLTYRNFFTTKSRWAYSGVRLASDG